MWNWAELIILYVQHILGVRPGEHGLEVRPRLPKPLKSASARLTFRGQTLGLKVARGGDFRVTVNGKSLGS